MSEPQVVRKARLSRAARGEQLLDIAERLFVDHGYAAVTMEDIARAAGVTRPVVYDHFQTREGAYLACVERARHSFEELLTAHLAPQEMGLRALLRQGGSAYFDLLEADPAKWRLIFASTAVLPGAHADRLEKLRFGTIAAIADAIRIARPEAPSRTVEAASHAISGIGERLGRWWLADPTLTKEEVLEHFVALTWSGVAPLE